MKRGPVDIQLKEAQLSHAVYFDLTIFRKEFGVLLERKRLDNGDDAVFLKNELLFPIIDFNMLNILQETAKKLAKIKHCEGFKSLEFGNPSQFFSTIFEVDCIYYAITQLNATDIVISPEVKVGEKKKHPDFKFRAEDNRLIYCECKSLMNKARIENKKPLHTIMNNLIDIIKEKKLALESHLQLEIIMENFPTTHNQKKFSDILIMRFEQLLNTKKIDRIIQFKLDEYELYIRITAVGNHDQFNKGAGGLENPHPPVRLRLGYDPKNDIKKGVKSSIKDALTQIPENEESIIFVQPVVEFYAKEAISSFYKNNKKKYLQGIYSYTNDFKFHKNPRI